MLTEHVRRIKHVGRAIENIEFVRKWKVTRIWDKKQQNMEEGQYNMQGGEERTTKHGRRRKEHGKPK